MVLVASIVPVAAVVLMAVVVFTVLGVVMVRRRRHRKYLYHLVKFSEMKDEEED